MKTKKLISILLTLCLLISSVSMVQLSAEAAPFAGAENFEQINVGGYGKTATRLGFRNATIVSGNNVTYILDRNYFSNLRDLGNIYYAEFSVNGMVVSTNITSSSEDYVLSERYVNNDTWISTSGNVSANISGEGYIEGEIPEAGESVEFTVSSNVSSKFSYSSFYLSDSTSVTANIKLIGKDSSKLQAKLGTAAVYDETCWTAESWAEYKIAVENAQSVIDNKASLQEDLDKAVEELDAARENLVHEGPITKCDYCKNSAKANSTTPIAYRDYVYGSDPVRQSMDLFLPSNATGDVSIIMYLHGGGWIYGDKSEYTGVAYNDCEKYGVATLTISYRYASPSVNAFDIISDMDTALAKSKELAAKHGLNIKKVMLYGGSAGGHLSLLYAYSQRTTGSVTPACVISHCGPTNLANTEYLNSNLGVNTILYELSSMSGVWFNESTMSSPLAQEALLKVSPINYVDSNSVPTVIVHGMKDETVPYSDAETLDKLLTLNNVPHDIVPYPNSNHGLYSDPAFADYAKKLFEQYVNTYLLDIKPVTEHNYISTVYEKTSTSDGYTMNICQTCGGYYISDIDPKLEVIFGIKEDTGIKIDEENKLILNVPQGIDSLEAYVETINCEIEYIESSEGFGTGTKFNVVSEGNVVETYTIVVSGDTDGDGYVDAFDVSTAIYYINTFTQPGEKAYFEAVDAYDDGVLDATDLAVIMNVANHV